MPTAQFFSPEPWPRGSDTRSTAVLALADGSAFYGHGLGASGEAVEIGRAHV